ncbi:heme exporter protein CcmD [Methylobacterium sp. J-090]|uniref:heme exporter protein CcmD n=1 Tax=Methylobacterium sp. J-090 TaxID=2836666 RepID=UPI001FBBEB50|nr:heme exporter protein CcmD [Methylobacterium sp. J-090]MCJ2080495.1 heme exporter protein CcmD [Methylobacterium sp. J-090]
MPLGPLDLGPHAGFILGAYAFTALVIAGLIGHAVRDRRAQTRALAALQDSSRPASQPPAERRA